LTKVTVNSDICNHITKVKVSSKGHMEVTLVASACEAVEKIGRDLSVRSTGQDAVHLSYVLIH
jgi:hypothetical protein